MLKSTICLQQNDSYPSNDLFQQLRDSSPENHPIRFSIFKWLQSDTLRELPLARISHEEFILVLKTKKKLPKIRRLY